METPHSAVPLPKRDRHYVRVLYARVGEVVRVISQSPRVVGRWHHWGDSHSELCTSDWGECRWCQRGRKQLWYGWLFGVDQSNGGACLLQLTEHAVRSNLSLRDEGVDLRGATVELERTTSNGKSVVRSKVYLHVNPGRFGPDEPDVLEHLRRFYGLARYPDGRHELPGVDRE